MKRTRLLVAAGVLATFSLAACGNSSTSGSESGDVIIGGALDMTGPLGGVGASELNGAKLAISQANENGGFNGRDFKIENIDLQSNTAEAAPALRKLSQEGVTAVIGPLNSAAVVAAAPLIEQLKLPSVPPTSNQAYADGTLNDWMFRVAPVLENPETFPELITALQEIQPFTRLAAIYDPDNSRLAAQVELLEEYADEVGYEVVASEALPEGSADASAQASRVIAANPDAIWLGAIPDSNASIIKLLRSRGEEATFISGAPDNTLGLAGEASVGTVGYAPFVPSSTDPKVTEFVEAYQAEYGEVPDQFAAQAYDAANVLIEAIRKSESTDPSKVRDALAEVSWSGVTGVISWDGSSDRADPSVKFVKWNGEELEEVGQFGS